MKVHAGASRLDILNM
uniref:Uncharacterized protein n=1 Tax=Anopheles arabiensis TaxID=7173 RepID=A0A182I1J0_ANOAR